jgi:hypothetical protein
MFHLYHFILRRAVWEKQVEGTDFGYYTLYCIFQGTRCKRVLVQETAALSEILSSHVVNWNWWGSPTARKSYLSSQSPPCLCKRKWVWRHISCWDYLTLNDISRYWTLRCFVFGIFRVQISPWLLIEVVSDCPQSLQVNSGTGPSLLTRSRPYRLQFATH